MKLEKRKTGLYISAVLSLIFSGATLALCHRQVTEFLAGNMSNSDMYSYILRIQGIEDWGGPHPYPLMFILGRIFTCFLGLEWGLATVIALLQMLSYWAVFYYFRKFLSKAKPLSAMQEGLLGATVYGLFFYSMIYSDVFEKWGIPNHYLGVFSPNPFHNATYLAARPFTILTFFIFVQLLEEYETKTDFKKLVWFSLLLLTATMTKPSFTLIFVVLAAIVLLWKLIGAKFRNFRQTFILGCAFVPTLIDLLYQYFGVFTGVDTAGEKAGIGIEYMGVWGYFSSNHWLALLLVMLFPFTVLLFHYKDLVSNTLYRMGWGLFTTGFTMFVFLYEKGTRKYHANFSWGYMAGLFFVVMVSVLFMLQDTIGREKKTGKLALTWGTFLVHVILGMAYFKWLFDGNYYG